MVICSGAHWYFVHTLADSQRTQQSRLAKRHNEHWWSVSVRNSGSDFLRERLQVLCHGSSRYVQRLSYLVFHWMIYLWINIYFSKSVFNLGNLWKAKFFTRKYFMHSALSPNHWYIRPQKCLRSLRSYLWLDFSIAWARNCEPIAHLRERNRLPSLLGSSMEKRYIYEMHYLDELSITWYKFNRHRSLKARKEPITYLYKGTINWMKLAHQ